MGIQDFRSEHVLLQIVTGLSRAKLLRTPDEYQRYYCLFCDGPETVFEHGEDGFIHTSDCIITLAKTLATYEDVS